MAEAFTISEWQEINDFLDRGDNAEMFGMPNPHDKAVTFTSWNIRKFGAFLNSKGQTAKTEGARAMIARYCSLCDFIAIQETLEDTFSLFDLLKRLNSGPNKQKYDVVMSDITGKRPGSGGMAERFAYIYNTEKIRLGRLASDITMDRAAILSNIGKAHRQALLEQLPEEDDPSWLDSAKRYLAGLNAERKLNKKLKQFVQFIRAPHLVEFIIDDPNDDTGKGYEIYCVNAHLVYGKSKKEREREFFALLEWLMLRAPDIVLEQNKVFMLMADLNLDFQSTVSKRQKGIENYIKSLNLRENMNAKVNFPFLDGGFLTNARESQTFDHIAFIAEDNRWPQSGHNKQSGTLGDDQYEFGMFNFTQAFVAAGPGRNPEGMPDYDRFAHDLSDHMPIWLRLPLPSAGQNVFET